MKTIRSTRFYTCLHLLLLLVLTFALSACESLRTWQANPNVQFAETEALKLGFAFLANGGKSDNLWSIGQGMNLIGDVWTFANTASPTSTVKDQVKAFADNPTAVNTLANGLAKVVSTAKTPADQAKVTLLLANGIQKAAAATGP